MLAPERLDEDSLRDLLRRTDKHGVLSVYVDADPRPDPNLRAVAIDLKNRYRELLRRMGEDGDAESSRELIAALERIWPQIERWWIRPGPDAAEYFRRVGQRLDAQLKSALPVANRFGPGRHTVLHPLLVTAMKGGRRGFL
ncbi:hypothetical protein H7I76_34890, partial [Mycolicibacterium vaccae]|nr:hypothetical protein [Mycolicibacterium vaccae]